MSSSADPPKPPKLNILALPSHTAILFGLMMTVGLGAACATLLPGSRLWWPPFVFGLTLLPLRDFLSRPDLMRRERRLTAVDDETTRALEGELTRLAGAPDGAAVSAAGRPPARILIAPPGHALESFGAFRRRYIAASRELADALCRGLRDPARRAPYRAILAHELAHFINQDVRLVWLAFAMLKALALVMALSLWFGLVGAGFVIEFGPEFLQAGFWSELARRFAAQLPGFPAPDLSPLHTLIVQQNPTLTAQLADPARGWANWQYFLLYLVGAQWPFVLVALVLLFGYWPRLLDVREMYADARAAALVGRSRLIRDAAVVYNFLAQPVMVGPPTRRERIAAWGARLAEALPRPARRLALSAELSPERLACLREPLVAFGAWRRIALGAGFAALLLDLVMQSMLGAGVVAEPGAQLPCLIAFVTFAVWLLPRVCSGADSPQRLTFGLVARLVAVFTAVKLLMPLSNALLAGGLLLFAPTALGQLLDAWAYALSGANGGPLPQLFGSEISAGQFLSLHVVRPFLYFALLLPPILAGSLWLNARLAQRILQWYPAGARVRRAFALVTAVLAAALALGVIPLLNHLVFPEIYAGWSAGGLLGLALTGMALSAAGVWLLRRAAELAGRCPNPECEHRIAGPYRLGAHCPACGAALHPWLIAPYATEEDAV